MAPGGGPFRVQIFILVVREEPVEERAQALASFGWVLLNTLQSVRYGDLSSGSNDVSARSIPIPSQKIQVTGVKHPTTASFTGTQLDGDSANPPETPEKEQGYRGKLKTAVLECVDSAKRAPETFEEALAVLRGERAVKPDYERAASTVAAVS